MLTLTRALLYPITCNAGHLESGRPDACERGLVNDSHLAACSPHLQMLPQ
jgi:hypothetical protein